MKPNWLMTATAIAIRQLYGPTRIRVRQWGALPARRGPTVLITNHQHEDEGETVIRRTFLRHPWKPIVMVNSRRTFERGFFAARFPRTAPFLRTFDPSGLFLRLNILPVENMLFSRPFTSLGAEIFEKHGDLPIADVLPENTLEELGLQGARLSDLWGAKFFLAGWTPVKLSQLRQPYRREAIENFRATAARDIGAIVERVRDGATFYVTPEGDYSRDGRLHRLRRGILDEVLPVAEPWLCAIAYDPFRGKRLSMLYRVVRPADPADLDTSLAAARPVTTSALLSAFLLASKLPFSFADAIRDVRERLRTMPDYVFVDPELQAKTAAAVREALATLEKRGTLERDGRRYRLTERRADRRFPHLDDMLVYQNNMLEETLEAAGRLAGVPAEAFRR
jgi:hypothetical protein